MTQATTDTGQAQTGRALAERFGALVKEQRKAIGMSQDDLALATGVGRRFVIDLESGKPGCELGRALLVAEGVGLRIFDLMSVSNADNALLPDLPDDIKPITKKVSAKTGKKT